MPGVISHWLCHSPAELKNGLPTLSVNHGSGVLTLQLAPRLGVTDRRWHRLDITNDGKVRQGAGGWGLEEAEYNTARERKMAVDRAVGRMTEGDLSEEERKQGLPH